jgi:hypothetical protein
VVACERREHPPLTFDPGIAGFLLLLGAMAVFAAWRASRRRHALRTLSARGYREDQAPPGDLIKLIEEHLGGEPQHAWQRAERAWAIELLPCAEDEESTVWIVVTAPLATAFDGRLLLRAWQGASPERLPGRLGTRVLEFGNERLAGLVRVPDPGRRLHGAGCGYLAYAERAFDLESRLPDAFLARLPRLAGTVTSLVLNGPDLLLKAPFDKVAPALDAVTELATRLSDTQSTTNEARS